MVRMVVEVMVVVMAGRMMTVEVMRMDWWRVAEIIIVVTCVVVVTARAHVLDDVGRRRHR